MNTNIQQKIKDYLKETILDSEENQDEIDSGHRPECEDGSDEIIEALGDYASALLSQIKKWENNSDPTWEQLEQTGMSPKMIEATLDGYKEED